MRAVRLAFTRGKTMRLSAIALAAALVASTGAYAEDLTNNVNLGGDAADILTGSFGVTHLESGEFYDTFNFSPSYGDWVVDSSLITIGFRPESDIDFLSAEINSHYLTLSPTGPYEYAVMLQEPITGPLVMHVYGRVNGIMDASASYAGTINIMPVPEPTTYGMLMGGLGILAWLARRRKAE
jgi:PEP-CTERM motif